MEDSLYDSFRWLDDDTDIDLSLDNYQQQVVNSACLPPKRRTSFRRTLSFNSVILSRKSISLASPGKALASSPTTDSQTVPANIVSSRSSLSRPTSKRKPRHTSQSSASSIDPSAQYYHDPEARLKLRVFLASPQKFDEAIEFGFPALKENGAKVPKPLQPGRDIQVRGFKGTFLDGDDDGLIRGDEKGPGSKISRFSYVTKNPLDSFDLSFMDNKRKPCIPLPEPNPQQTPNTREMTLRMTLTRPDLRADSCSTPTAMMEPMQLLHLPSAHDNSNFSEQDIEEPNLVRKMWHRFRRRND